MLSTAVRGGKVFAAEQKLRELKKRVSRLLPLQRNNKVKLKSPNAIIEKAVENMNSLPTVKYDIEPDKIEKRSLESEWFDSGLISDVCLRFQRHSLDTRDIKRKSA